MTAELRQLKDQTKQVTELKQFAEEEANRLQLMAKALEEEKQMLQEEVENLRYIIGYVRDITVQC